MKRTTCKHCGQPLFTYEQESAPFYRDERGEVHGSTVRIIGECTNVTCALWKVTADLANYDETTSRFEKAPCNA